MLTNCSALKRALKRSVITCKDVPMPFFPPRYWFWYLGSQYRLIQSTDHGGAAWWTTWKRSHSTVDSTDSFWDKESKVIHSFRLLHSTDYTIMNIIFPSFVSIPHTPTHLNFNILFMAKTKTVVRGVKSSFYFPHLMLFRCASEVEWKFEATVGKLDAFKITV